MKRLKLITTTVLIFGIGYLLNAQTSMNVVPKTGSTVTTLLSDIKKLTFPTGNMSVYLNASPNTPTNYALTSLKNVNFLSGSNPPPPVTCLNTNGDFETSAMTNWTVWPGTTTSSVASKALVVTSTSAGAWDIQASTFYNFEANQLYEITFDAMSPTQKDIVVMIRENFAPVAGLEYTKTIPTTMTKQTVSFTYPATASTKGELLLAIGGSTGITIDNVCIAKKTFSTDENVISNNFLLYPNPVKTSFNINVPSSGKVEVVSLNGQVLVSSKVNGNENNTINIENLSSGIYLCRYTNNKEVKTLKLIKQ